ncbi:hypothetical protein GPALN_014891 [Globodera pallida]|nr:hypothetical protein GPALN_014891 [Globodera pallida]
MYSRKNDTTPWFYMLLHMYGGPLGLKTKEEALRSCPSEFRRIHELIEALQPHQRPEYENRLPVQTPNTGILYDWKKEQSVGHCSQAAARNETMKQKIKDTISLK